MTDLDRWADEAYELKKPGTFELPLDYCSGYRDGFEKAVKLITFKMEQRKRQGPAFLDRDLFQWLKNFGKGGS